MVGPFLQLDAPLRRLGREKELIALRSVRQRGVATLARDTNSCVFAKISHSRAVLSPDAVTMHLPARLMDRRPIKVAAVALANKIAQMAWAMMVRGERSKEPKLLPAA